MKKFTQITGLFLLFFGLLPAAYAQSNFKVKSSNGANLRQGPSTDKQVVSSVPAGAKLKIVDKSNASWYKVEYNGKTGYVSSSLIEEDKDETPEKKSTNNNTATADEKANNNNTTSNSPSGQKQSNSSARNKNSSKSNSASSGEYTWGVGLRLGDPAGITVKKYNGGNAWEFNLGKSSRWGYNYGNSFYRYSKYDDKDNYRYAGYYVGFSTALQVHYLWQKPINGAQGLSFYYGGGAQIRFTPVTYRYYYSEDWWSIREDRVTNIDLGLDGTLGLEYTFSNAPVSMFLDATLFMEVVDAPFLFSGQGGIGVRYNF